MPPSPPSGDLSAVIDILKWFSPFLSQGHQADPVQVLPYRRLTSFVRMLQQRPDLRERINRVRLAYRPNQRLGPVSLPMEALLKAGWQWVDDCHESQQGSIA